jgi:hypothetical protein
VQKARHGESAPNEKQVLRWQTFAFIPGPPVDDCYVVALSDLDLGEITLYDPTFALGGFNSQDYHFQV